MMIQNKKLEPAVLLVLLDILTQVIQVIKNHLDLWALGKVYLVREIEEIEIEVDARNDKEHSLLCESRPSQPVRSRHRGLSEEALDEWGDATLTFNPTSGFEKRRESW